MHQLIEAFEELFVAAAQSGGALAKTAGFVLANVDWTGKLNKPQAISHPVVDKYLETACANSGQHGSSTHKVAQALLAVTNQLAWPVSTRDREDEPDVAIFARNYIANRIIGEGGLLPSNKVTAGFSLQGPDTYYPPHAHHAEESYWIIGGNGDWKVGKKPWFAVEAGDCVYHASGARHAMQTNEEAMLTVWLWTSHLDSAVLIVRS